LCTSGTQGGARCKHGCTPRERVRQRDGRALFAGGGRWQKGERSRGPATPKHGNELASLESGARGKEGSGRSVPVESPASSQHVARQKKARGRVRGCRDRKGVAHGLGAARYWSRRCAAHCCCSVPPCPRERMAVARSPAVAGRCGACPPRQRRAASRPLRRARALVASALTKPAARRPANHNVPGNQWRIQGCWLPVTTTGFQATRSTAADGGRRRPGVDRLTSAGLPVRLLLGFVLTD
jgi:hypothetical protein